MRSVLKLSALAVLVAAGWNHRGMHRQPRHARAAARPATHVADARAGERGPHESKPPLSSCAPAPCPTASTSKFGSS